MRSNVLVSIKMISLSIIFAILGHIAFGAQNYEFTKDIIIEGKISATEINRIKIDGDRIREVIGLSDNYTVQGDNKTGQLFIKNINQTTTAPAIFSIITENNRTIDLKLTPSSISSETIIIRLKEDQNDDKAIYNSNNKIYGSVKYREQERIVELIKSIAQEDFSKLILQERKNDKLLSQMIVKKIIGKSNVEIWEITNISDAAIVIEEKELFEDLNLIRAIAIENRYLNSGSKTKAYVVIDDR
ncbi:MAG: hypothetical protein EOP34_03225 [Rickettsiales bacterium]|nr:MAG: hypothetical protein EOP34_03225 [Rickettsiales bacterium]